MHGEKTVSAIHSRAGKLAAAEVKGLLLLQLQSFLSEEVVAVLHSLC